MKILTKDFAEELSFALKDFFEVEKIITKQSLIEIVFSNGQVFSLTISEKSNNL